MSTFGPWVVAAFALLVGWLVARACGTWLVWTHHRQWMRGYLAENNGRARSAIPTAYGSLKRRAWLAGWDCSHETAPYEGSWR